MLGSYGQTLYIDPKANMVIAHFSSNATPSNEIHSTYSNMYIDIASFRKASTVVEAFSLQYIIYTTIPIIFSLLEDIENNYLKYTYRKFYKQFTILIERLTNTSTSFGECIKTLPLQRLSVHIGRKFLL